MGHPSRHRHSSSGSGIGYSSLSSHAPNAMLRRVVSPQQSLLHPALPIRAPHNGPPFFIGDRNLRSTSEASSLNFESPPFALSSSANQSPLKQVADLSTNSVTLLPSINLAGSTGGPIAFSSPTYPRRPSTSYSVATGTDQSSPLMSQDILLSPELAKVDTRARHASHHNQSRSSKNLNSIDTTALFPDFHPTTLTPELISHFGGVENLTAQGQAKAQGCRAASPLTPSTPRFPPVDYSATPAWANMHSEGESSFGPFQDVPACQSASKQQPFVDFENDILSTSPSDLWPITIDGSESSLSQTMFPTESNMVPQSTLLSTAPTRTIDMNNWLQCSALDDTCLPTDTMLFRDLQLNEPQPPVEQSVGINPASMLLSNDPMFGQALLQSQNTPDNTDSQANSVPSSNTGHLGHSRHHSEPEFASSDFSAIFVFPQDIEATPDFKRPDDILDYSIPPTPAEEVRLPENLRYSLNQTVPFEPSVLSAEINQRFDQVPFTFPAREEVTGVTDLQGQAVQEPMPQSCEKDDCSTDHQPTGMKTEGEVQKTSAAGVPDDLENIEGYSCPVHLCGMMFLTEKDYMQHLDVNHGTTPDDLPNFLVRYGIDKASIKRRNADPSKGPSVCWICESRFGRRYDLTRHLATVHATKQSPWSCYYCEPATVLSRSDAQQRHMSTAHPHLADALHRLVMKRKKGRGRKKGGA